MFDKFSSHNIWVSQNGPENGNGTIETPYNKLTKAVDKAEAGSVIVLMPGEYNEPVTINEKKGEKDRPITICSDPELPTPKFIFGWYLYELSDFIISDIIFDNCDNSAISLVGKSERNIFKNIRIKNSAEETGCAIFFGGSNGSSNIVERCTIEYDEIIDKQIGVMISQSIDIEDSKSTVSINGVVRYSTFINCYNAILIGSSDEVDRAGNHLVEENIFIGCNEAVRIKSIGAIVKESIFKNCQTAISHVGGSDIDILDNRFENCKKAISAQSGDITIHDSTFIESAISIESSDSAGFPVIIHNNNFINKNLQPVTVETKDEISVVLSHNIFSGIAPAPFEGLHFTNNLSDNKSTVAKTTHFTFNNEADGDYSILDIDCGTESQSTFKLKIRVPEEVSFKSISEHQHGNEGDVVIDNSKGSIEERDLYLKTLFLNNEADEEEENEGDGHSQMPFMRDNYDAGLIDE